MEAVKSAVRLLVRDPTSLRAAGGCQREAFAVAGGTGQLARLLVLFDSLGKAEPATQVRKKVGCR